MRCRPMAGSAWQHSSPSNQRIDGFERFEPAKVTVCSPKYGDTVFKANGRNAGIVKLPTVHLCLVRQIGKNAPVVCPTVQDLHMRSGQPCVNLPTGLVQAAGRMKNLRIRHDGQKLMQAADRNSPPLIALCQCLQTVKRLGMKSGVTAVRLHQQIGVKGNHGLGCARRVSTCTSSICCHSRGLNAPIF